LDQHFEAVKYEPWIELDWFDSCTAAFKEIAIDWLESHDMAYANEFSEASN
jgi:hypothetical protein